MNRVYSTVVSLLAAVAISACGALVFAQGNPAPQQSQAQPAPYAGRETDIGFNFYEALNSSTTGMGVTQTPTNSPGGMFEVRHIQSPFIGYEITYSYNPADETIAPTAAPGCGISCSTPPQRLPSKGSTVGLDWIVSKKFGALRPFAAGGMGFFIDEPAYSVDVGQVATRTDTNPVNDVIRPAWLYGGGVDFAISQHLGVRAQFRGMLYKAPNLSTMFPAQGVYTTTYMPMGGVFYTF